MSDGRIDKDGPARPYVWEYRNLDWDSATDAGVNPVVINTWYTPLAVTDDVKAWYLTVEQTNTGATDETLEVELTVNGVAYTIIWLATSGQTRYVSFIINGTILAGNTAPNQMLSLDLDQSAPLETRSLGIRVRQTTVVDAVSAIIEVNMVYATLEVT